MPAVRTFTFLLLASLFLVVGCQRNAKRVNGLTGLPANAIVTFEDPTISDARPITLSAEASRNFIKTVAGDAYVLREKPYCDYIGIFRLQNREFYFYGVCLGMEDSVTGKYWDKGFLAELQKKGKSADFPYDMEGWKALLEEVLTDAEP